MAGAIITIIIFYLLHVWRGYARLWRQEKKINKWRLQEGRIYMIRRNNGTWHKATFINPFFKLSDSSFTVDLDNVDEVNVETNYL